MAFGVLLAANLVLMASTAKRVTPDDGTEQTVLRAWTVAALTPIQNALGWVVSGVSSIWSGYVDLRGAREKAEALEAENARLRQENEAKSAAALEAERLREIAGLKGKTTFEFVTADVVARDASTWFRRVTIDKGTTSGIQLNMPVVTPGGLVGRVTAVGLNASVIQLITDEHAGAGGRLSISRAAGEIKGRGDGSMRFKSISSVQEIDQEAHEAIVTSGLDKIYPAGILIGFVDTVAKGAGALPHDIRVRPAAPLDRLEEVMVLLVKPQDLQTPEGIK